jgi:hypothetical protein
MAISDDGAASGEHKRVTFGEATPAQRQKVRKLRDVCCEFDISGMLDIVRKLQEMVSAA